MWVLKYCVTKGLYGELNQYLEHLVNVLEGGAASLRSKMERGVKEAFRAFEEERIVETVNLFLKNKRVNEKLRNKLTLVLKRSNSS